MDSTSVKSGWTKRMVKPLITTASGSLLSSGWFPRNRGALILVLLWSLWPVGSASGQQPEGSPAPRCQAPQYPAIGQYQDGQSLRVAL